MLQDVGILLTIFLVFRLVMRENYAATLLLYMLRVFLLVEA